MLVCQTAYEALLESIQLCSVNARQVIDVGVQMDEVKDSTVCESLTCEESSYSNIEVSTDAVNIENEVRSNLSSEIRSHPESMGAVERWNRTLKDMLNKNIQEHGNEWDVHLPYLLFAYREIPHALTGVSPYQLVYGRLPSGPMTILKEFWTREREIPTDAARSVEEYLKQMQKKLQDAHYNLRSRGKKISVGDEVLILMPSCTHKLLNTWIGSAKVVKLTRPHSCLVRMEDGNTRELHVNKLRPYISRVDHVGIIFDQDTDFGELHYAPTDKENQPNIDIELNQMPDVLNAQQKYQLRNLLQRYEDIFRNRPGKARVKGHSVKVTADSSPKRLQPYEYLLLFKKKLNVKSMSC
ncbi:retrovirus-related Pol polyprotein from transposon opus [Trichonephila clavata]|uniref:Retrovirus-related Pol polyprotein from transposon opus n=1 Tax=Trichonephila clavata TaxID=2740835 RepID=A0A8X6GPN2_TRICU|nr:retrovirus-related Pol polyprotein from transposon opus [Trichonephila clavata]